MKIKPMTITNSSFSSRMPTLRKKRDNSRTASMRSFLPKKMKLAREFRRCWRL